jgi:DHA2 family multidrug resistance protein
MTSTQSIAVGGPPPAPPVPTPFNGRLIVGLLGVLIAALASGLNNRVTDIALNDVRGVLGMGFDEGTWVRAAYAAAEVAAMMVSAWCAVTFSLRRFAVAVVLLFALLGAVFPFVQGFNAIIALRIAQGLLGGALPPLLMTVALRFLPPPIKLYGLSAYALTATFGPNLAVPLVALWTGPVGWQFVYWQIIPPCLIAAAMIAYGLPQDPLRLERFRQFDWVGVLTGCGGMAALVIGLEQGERLDWFNSPLICVLLGSAAVSLVVFCINEWHHPLPLFKLQILARRNFSHGLLALGGLLTVFMSGSMLPSLYLGQVQDFKPLEIGPLALSIAIPQLLAAPAAAALCNLRWLDSRFVMATGLALLVASCFAGSFLTSDWGRDNFYLLQAMQALGQPLAVLPILMGATGVVQPMEGPFASAMFNTVRGLSTAVGATVIEVFIAHRERFHWTMLLDRAGNLAGRLPQTAVGARLGSQVHEQVVVLSLADAYLLIMGIALALVILLMVLPVRALPPQSVFIQPSK